MKNFSIIAAVVALALTLAFIVQFSSANEESKKSVGSKGSVAVVQQYPKVAPNTVNRQTVKVGSDSESVQQVKIAQ